MKKEIELNFQVPDPSSEPGKREKLDTKCWRILAGHATSVEGWTKDDSGRTSSD